MAKAVTAPAKKHAPAPKESHDTPHPPAKRHEKVEVIIRKKLFGESPEEKHFVVSDGRKLKNLRDLILALETMGDDIFSYHVNEAKNDFSAWLHDVFSFEHLAAEISNAKHRLEMQRLIMRNLIKEIEKLEKQTKGS